MSARKISNLVGMNGRMVADSARTAIATLISLLLARALKFPEYYWAPISTIIIMQSSIQPFQGAWQRFVGTALGAALGGDGFDRGEDADCRLRHLVRRPRALRSIAWSRGRA